MRESIGRRSKTTEIRLPGHEELIAPVTILDGQGRVVRVVPAREFRAALATLRPPTLPRSPRGKDSA